MSSEFLFQFEVGVGSLDLTSFLHCVIQDDDVGRRPDFIPFSILHL